MLIKDIKNEEDGKSIIYILNFIKYNEFIAK